MPPRGFGSIPLHLLCNAMITSLKYLYTNDPKPLSPKGNQRPNKLARNKLIQERYSDGLTIPEIAKIFNISLQRVHQIIHNRRK